MSTSPTTPTTADRLPLRLALSDGDASNRHGVWWPQSRNLQVEAADLVDHFPPDAGRIYRLLFSRPDWDGSAPDGRSVRRIQARRGPVKVGSFPSDDTHLMILTLSTGKRLPLVVVPPGSTEAEAEHQLRLVDHIPWS